MTSCVYDSQVTRPPLPLQTTLVVIFKQTDLFDYPPLARPGGQRGTHCQVLCCKRYFIFCQSYILKFKSEKKIRVITMPISFYNEMLFCFLKECRKILIFTKGEHSGKCHLRVSD